MSTPSNPSITPPGGALPIQYTPFTADHFKTPEGIAFVNLQLQQFANAINAGNGAAGRVTLPHGVDVRGATVTGLGDPKQATDAVSQAHVSTTYGYGAQRAQLDIGGDHALKGLTWAVGKIKQLQTTQQAAFDGSVNFFNISGFIVQFGLIADMDTAVFPMNFPEPFPNTCLALVALTTGPNDRITYASTLPTATQFTLANNGAGAGAFYIAVGW